MSVTLEDFDIRAAILVCELLPPPDIAVYEALSGERYDPHRAAVLAYSHSTFSWVFAGDTVPLAVGGFSRLNPGTLRTWFYAQSLAWLEMYGRDMTKCVRNVIQSAFDQKLAHRIETVTLANQGRARAWYEKIGLKYESTLRGFGVNGEDAVMYVALRDAERV